MNKLSVVTSIQIGNWYITDELLGVIRLASRIKGIGPILARIIEDLAGIVTGGDTFLRAFQDSWMAFSQLLNRCTPYSVKSVINNIKIKINTVLDAN